MTTLLAASIMPAVEISKIREQCLEVVRLVKLRLKLQRNIWEFSPPLKRGKARSMLRVFFS